MPQSNLNPAPAPSGLARHMAGYQIGRVQQGKDPDDWKPLPTIGLNVREIRIGESSGAFRIVYQATLTQYLKRGQK
jgi:phage-related protein